MRRGLDDDFLMRALDAELPSDGSAERIMDAALEHAEDFGLRRFTMDDVARRAGLSRVTIYRYFPKKDQLLNAVLMRELRRFLTRMDAVIADAGTPEAKLTEGLIFCLEFLRGHRLLNRLLRTEPELILPQLTVRGSVLISAAREWIAAHIRAEVSAGHLHIPERDIDGIAELLVRTVISLVISPDTVLPADDPKAIRHLTTRYLTPLISTLGGSDRVSGGRGR